MKILTLGNGFVAKHLSYEKIIDRITPNQSQISSLLEYHKPDVIINCIGFCGKPNIDQCEIEKEKTIVNNTIIPMLLAVECEKRNIHFIHIGSGCIFNGESSNLHYLQRDGNPMPDPNATTFTIQYPCQKIDDGWKEIDIATPQSFYSKTKYATDLAIGDLPNTTVLRIRMPVSDKDDPRNLLNKLRGYSKVINIPNSMTFMDDLVRCVDHVIAKKLTGIYHVVNPPDYNACHLNAAVIMQEYQKHQSFHQFEIIDENQLSQLTKVKRSNCILNIRKLENTGFQMTKAQQALKQCMPRYIENIRNNHV